MPCSFDGSDSGCYAGAQPRPLLANCIRSRASALQVGDRCALGSTTTGIPRLADLTGIAGRCGPMRECTTSRVVGVSAAEDRRPALDVTSESVMSECLPLRGGRDAGRIGGMSPVGCSPEKQPDSLI